MNVSFNRVHLIYNNLGKESNQNRRFKRQFALIDYVPDKYINRNICEKE